MQAKETASSYAELTTQTYQLFVEAMSSYNQRALEYAKSVYEIVTRPYASSALETTVRENFDRANQIMSLAVSELQTSGQKAAEFNEKLVAHAVKVQDSYVGSLRGAVDTGISNMNFVKDTATQQFEQLAKRMEEAQSYASAQVSAN